MAMLMGVKMKRAQVDPGRRVSHVLLAASLPTISHARVSRVCYCEQILVNTRPQRAPYALQAVTRAVVAIKARIKIPHARVRPSCALDMSLTYLAACGHVAHCETEAQCNATTETTCIVCAQGRYLSSPTTCTGWNALSLR